MLHVDFIAPAWRHRDMDETTEEQIRALLMRIGMIMEDASGTALMLKPTDITFVERLDAVARAIDGAGILLRAAAVLYDDELTCAARPDRATLQRHQAHSLD